MKIIYILPNGTVKSGGNWVTVTRLAEGFKQRKILVDIIEVKDVTKKCLEKYHVIHAFHAFKSLAKIKDLLMDMDKDKAVVVSFTGTDLKQLQEIEENKDKIIDLLNKTQAVIVFHDEDRKELIRQGLVEEKVKVIPQTAVPMALDHSDMVTQSSDYITFIFAAGIRKVKAPLKAINMVSKLAEKIKNIKLVIVGPILEEELGIEIKNKIKNEKWVEYLGEVSHKEAQNLIWQSDIVINTSISEGMPSTLLEAQQLGKPILATDIAGNRAIVSHGENGYLFKESEEFEYYAKKLIRDSKLRKKMGESALKSTKKYDLSQEIDMYSKVYID